MTFEELLADQWFAKTWADYWTRGHLSYYGSLNDRLAKVGTSIEELQNIAPGPNCPWRKH